MQNDCSTRALQSEEVDPHITRLPFLVAWLNYSSMTSELDCCKSAHADTPETAGAGSQKGVVGQQSCTLQAYKQCCRLPGYQFCGHSTDCR